MRPPLQAPKAPITRAVNTNEAKGSHPCHDSELPAPACANCAGPSSMCKPWKTGITSSLSLFLYRIRDET
jgi:hypothetical protein